jgi:transcriptional regulator with XRE-family HTH domain
MDTRKSDQKTKAWDDARKRHHLSQAQAQMARELGMNPAKLGKIDNHKQEPWKLPLPEFIEELYMKRFGRPAPSINAVQKG